MISSGLTRNSLNASPSWRILHTESSMEMGGQEYRVLDEALGMATRGHEVIVAVPKGSQMASLAQQKQMSVELTASRKTSWINLVSTYLQIIRRHRIEIVNTHGSLDSWTASVASRLSSLKPIIIRTRHKSTPISQTWRHQWLYKHLPHGVMTTSESIRGEIVDRQGLNPGRTIAVPTGVDLRQFNVAAVDHDGCRSEMNIGQGNVVLGTVAFLRDYKGLHLCLDVVRILKKEFPSLVYLIVGDGPEERNLRAKTQNLGLTHDVRFLSFRRDIPRLLASMNVFILPSIGGEGVPQAVTQAMAMGVPVVATSIGGIPEVVIHEETGMLAPANNVEALTDCIRVVLNDMALRNKMISKAQALVTQSYSLDTMLDAVEQFYGEIFRKTHRSELDRMALN